MKIKFSITLALASLIIPGFALADDAAIIANALSCKGKLSSKTIEGAVKRSIKGKYAAQSRDVMTLKKPINLNGIEVSEIVFTVEDSDAGLFAGTYAFTDKSVVEIKKSANLGKAYKSRKTNNRLYHANYITGGWIYDFSIENNKGNEITTDYSPKIKSNKSFIFGCSIGQPW